MLWIFKKILVVNVNWLGDVVFSSAVFKSLKEAYPQAQIFCLAPSRVKEVLESVPFVSKIISYDEEGRHKDLRGKLRLIAELRQNNFDAAFILHRSLTRALLVFCTGIPVRVGYNTKGRGIFLTHKIPEPTQTLHRQDYYLRILEGFGISVNERQSWLEVDSSHLADIDHMLLERGIGDQDFLIVLNPGGNWELKRWPKENSSKLVERLFHEFNGQKNLKIIISGAQKDVPLVKEILDPLPLNSQQKIVNLAGELKLKTLIALMKRANLVVSADTGPLHMAASVGTRTLAIFGPTDPEITGPRGSCPSEVLKVDVGCNRGPCYYLQCPENTCMRAVTAGDVFEKIRECLEK